MDIEVLYFEGCPNYRPTVDLIGEILKEEGISAAISEVDVSDPSFAQEVRFLGSPTVRVNGLDVEPSARLARDYGMMCRTYAFQGQRLGFPPRDTLRQAILEADPGIGDSGLAEGPSKESKRASLFAAGSVIAAIIGSLCCILPIVFALTGVGILGASALFDAWRPYLLVLTFGLLGLGFYFAYRPGRVRCAPGSACAIPATKRSVRMVLWIATGAVILIAAFPYYSGAVAELLLSNASSEAASELAEVRQCPLAYARGSVLSTVCNRTATRQGADVTRSATTSLERSTT